MAIDDLMQPLISPSPNQQEFSEDQDLRSVAQEVRSIERDTLPETATIGRNITWSSAYILAISRVIGSGVFATPGAIAKSVGSVGLTLLLWVVGTILSICGLAVSLEYGCMLPRSGGHKVYLEFTYRRPKFLASTIVAVQAVVLGFAASNCIVFSKYVFFAFSVTPNEFQTKLLAVGLLTTVSVVHGCFLRAGIWIQNLLGWVKVATIVFMAATGILVIIFQPQHESRSSASTAGVAGMSWEELWRGSNWTWNALSTSLFKVIYSYAGLDNVNNVLNEVRDPVRTLKTVSSAALITASCLYILANISYFLVVPFQEIKESGELVAALFFERVFGPTLGRSILPLVIATCAAGNVMVVTFALARLNQEIARQGFLPFSRILSSSRPFNTPLGGIIVLYIPSFLVLALPPQSGIYNFILDVEGYPWSFFTLAISVGLLLLRVRRPDLKRPFKAWLPAVWLRVLVYIAMIIAPFFPPPDWKGDVDFFYATYALVGFGVIILGACYWYLWIILLPRWKGYTIEEKVEILEDGTSITKLMRSPQ